MRTMGSNSYMGRRRWFRSVLAGQRVVLCRTSALECLWLFSGYNQEDVIDVYALEPGKYENINYIIVDTFDGMDVIDFGGIICTSVNQTINDMLHLYSVGHEKSLDEQSLVESLASYYYSNNESFKGLKIRSENMERFNILREWAVEYYDY